MQLLLLPVHFAGVNALQESINRASRRAGLPRNIGKGWSDEEHERLVTAFKAGHPVTEIAEQHGRTVGAIEARLEKYDLIQPSERTTENRFDKETRKSPQSDKE